MLGMYEDFYPNIVEVTKAAAVEQAANLAKQHKLEKNIAVKNDTARLHIAGQL